MDYGCKKQIETNMLTWMWKKIRDEIWKENRDWTASLHGPKRRHRKEKKNNIVISRLKEQTGKNREENVEKDRAEVKKIMDPIDTNPEYKAELE